LSQELFWFATGWYPYQIHAWHALLPGGYQRRLNYSIWLVGQGAAFLDNVIIGDKASFSMNGQVNTRNSREYAPMGNPLAFNYDRSNSREKQAFGLGLLAMELSLILIFSREISTVCLICWWSTNLPFREFGIAFDWPQYANEMFPGLWWLQDGAPSHGFRPVRQRLQVLFPRRVVALHEATEFPWFDSIRLLPMGLCEKQGLCNSPTKSWIVKKLIFYVKTDVG